MKIDADRDKRAEPAGDSAPRLGRRPPARDAAATKRRILKASRAEFARHGYSGARMHRIARAARANKRMLYYHVGNKDREAPGDWSPMTDDRAPVDDPGPAADDAAPATSLGRSARLP